MKIVLSKKELINIRVKWIDSSSEYIWMSVDDKYGDWNTIDKASYFATYKDAYDYVNQWWKDDQIRDNIRFIDINDNEV